ncbi:hypothetical protein [Pseudomonas sp. Larv2_ips]|uniref:hypothetical protein n=1 Tax=Pseudomonas sp. Larv2_ips TaxID=1896942 RepID=UPI000E6BDF02|nr:hypothetical protein [Pseudomonas sp. Larv2_ips]
MTDKTTHAIHASTYRVAGPEDKRIMAVSAALDLIGKRAALVTSHGVLEYEMAKLSDYADQIQAAIDKK